MLIVSLERTILQNIQTNFAIGNCVTIVHQKAQVYIPNRVPLDSLSNPMLK